MCGSCVSHVIGVTLTSKAQIQLAPPPECTVRPAFPAVPEVWLRGDPPAASAGGPGSRPLLCLCSRARARLSPDPAHATWNPPVVLTPLKMRSDPRLTLTTHFRPLPPRVLLLPPRFTGPLLLGPATPRAQASVPVRAAFRKQLLRIPAFGLLLSPPRVTNSASVWREHRGPSPRGAAPPSAPPAVQRVCPACSGFLRAQHGAQEVAVAESPLRELSRNPAPHPPHMRWSTVANEDSEGGGFQLAGWSTHAFRPLLRPPRLEGTRSGPRGDSVQKGLGTDYEKAARSPLPALGPRPRVGHRRQPRRARPGRAPPDSGPWALSGRGRRPLCTFSSGRFVTQHSRGERQVPNKHPMNE